MGRRNKCKTPLTKQENRLKKDGRLSITGVGQSTQYFPAKAGDAHAQDYGDGGRHTRGVIPRNRRTGLDTRRHSRTSDNSWVHAVLFVVLVVIVISWALGY
jgi:hypothetical protein